MTNIACLFSRFHSPKTTLDSDSHPTQSCSFVYCNFSQQLIETVRAASGCLFMRKWRCIISLQCSGGRHSSQCPRELTKPVVHGLRRTAGDFMYVDLHLAGGEIQAISRDPRHPYLSSWRSDLCATGHSTLSSCIILKTRCLCTVKFYNLFADMNYTTQLTFKQTL